jgi:hypothetical protein
MGRKVNDIRPKAWASPNELKGRPFMIVNATKQPSPFRPNEEVVEIHYAVCKWEPGKDAFPAEGTMTMGIGGREWIVDAFAGEESEAIGPVTIVEQFMTNGQRFWGIVDLPVDDVEMDDEVAF